MSLVGKKSQVLKLTLSLKWRQHENQHFEEATKKQKVLLFWYQKILLSSLLNCTLFKLLYQNLINEILL
jgi:hypothetical protein